MRNTDEFRQLRPNIWELWPIQGKKKKNQNTLWHEDLSPIHKLQSDIFPSIKITSRSWESKDYPFSSRVDNIYQAKWIQVQRKTHLYRHTQSIHM